MKRRKIWILLSFVIFVTAIALYIFFKVNQYKEENVLNERSKGTVTITENVTQSETLINVSGPYNYLKINGKYWISAKLLDNGMYAIYVSVSVQKDSHFADYTLDEGTQVTLIDVDADSCKVEGEEFTGNYIVQGWIDCERLIDFEPTAIPYGLEMRGG